ncbi:hypothetical protein [Nocardia arizonensis]|uniref:hypothetical protein n=1 Tax=Nocardia arizonensis TaxID=1141647 RepID=UPI0006D20A5E|nr:hypothetical protein [Nocardia arizonensis]
MDLLKLCKYLRLIPRSYLLDDRYVTAVAFIDGFNIGQAGAPLSGFPEYLLDKFFAGKHSPYHWSYLILASEDDSLLGYAGLREISPELDTILIRKMLELLIEFTTRK